MVTEEEKMYHTMSFSKCHNKLDTYYTIDRILIHTRVSVPSSELGPPTNLPQQASVSPSLDPKGGATLACGPGGPNSDDWTESLALCILFAADMLLCYVRIRLFTVRLFPVSAIEQTDYYL